MLRSEREPHRLLQDWGRDRRQVERLERGKLAAQLRARTGHAANVMERQWTLLPDHQAAAGGDLAGSARGGGHRGWLPRKLDLLGGECLRLRSRRGGSERVVPAAMGRWVRTVARRESS